MAEKDASLAIENAVEQLIQATRLLQKVNKFKKLRKSRSEINKLSKLVEEFDGQEYESEVAEWLRKVKEVAYESQNVIDNIVADTNLQNQRSKFKRLLSGGRRRITNHQEDEIHKIADRMEGIADRMESIAESFKEPEIDEVVGFELLQKALISDLLNESRQQRDVILIEGKPGSGKTTLAKMVYNNTLIKKHFVYRKWVYIPKKTTLEASLREILRHTNRLSNQTDDLLDEVQLKGKLSECLKKNKYLIVLDSMHNSDAWNELLTSFPDVKGSRVLLTSRTNKQPSAINSSHEIKPLDINQSWKILSSKVFSGDDCPINLKMIGEKMVEECKGSPRAVVALAAILYHAEKTEKMWSKFLNDSHQGKQISDLSNYPDRLCAESQLCFLYLGLFPGDIHIPANQIIKIWIAEGLLKQKESQRAEEIGKDYLKKMITESFIQEGMRRADGSLKNCLISSIVTNFCVTNAEEIEVHPSTNSSPENNPKNSQSTQTHSKKRVIRLAIHGDSGEDVLRSLQSCSHMRVRSLHCSVKNVPSTSVSSNDLSGILQHNSDDLRVLNLGSLQLDRVPKLLAEMKNLTYLRLSVRTPNCLPSSIGNLRHLETLDMRDSDELKVPHELWKIKSLRHLYVGSFSMPDTKGMQYYNALLSLQTLSGVHSDKVLKCLMVRAKFPNVRRLRICSLKEEATFSFLNSLDHLYHLESLRVERPTTLPDAHAFPLSLQKLILMETEFQPDCIKKLEKLPNLKVLKLLQKAISGDKIECSAEGFLRLEVLCMENLALKQLTAQKSAMKCLKHLIIKGNPALIVPDHLEQVATRH